MYVESNTEYKKAYAELYEIIKSLNEEEKSKIPKSYVEFVDNNRDKEYTFKFDKEKSLLEQDIKVETKALLVKLYKEYIADENEKEYWKRYDYKCFEIIEEEKRKRYNLDIFNKQEDKQEKIKEEKQEKKEVVEYKENWISKIAKLFKKLLRIK